MPVRARVEMVVHVTAVAMDGFAGHRGQYGAPPQGRSAGGQTRDGP
jgi:hypothetical protein